MKAKDFLEEIDYYNTNVEGQLYEELGIETLADMMELYHERKLKLLGIGGVIERYSGENLMKLQKHFVSLYGSDEMAQEKANSLAVGFGKACELITKDLNAL